MHASATASHRSPWAGLDALVLEEIEALRTSPPPLRHAPSPPAPDFASDEEFLMRALRYLADHPDPGALVAGLSAGFPPAPKPEGPSAADEGLSTAPAPAEESAAAPDRSAADEGGKAEERP